MFCHFHFYSAQQGFRFRFPKRVFRFQLFPVSASVAKRFFSFPVISVISVSGPKRVFWFLQTDSPASPHGFFGFRKRFLCGFRERFFVFSVPRLGHMGFPVFRFPRQPKTVFRGFRFLVKMGFQWVAKRVFGFLVSAKWVFSVKRVFMLLKPFGALKPPENSFISVMIHYH